MPTTPNGFWYPDRYDTVNSISGLFAQQAASADAALDGRILQDGIPKFSDAATRDAAFVNNPPSVGALTYIASSASYDQWDGTSWKSVIGQNVLNTRVLGARGLGTNTDVPNNSTINFATPITFSLSTSRVVRFSGAIRITWPGTLTGVALALLRGVGNDGEVLWRTTYRSRPGDGDEWEAFSNVVIVTAGTHTANIAGQTLFSTQTINFHQRSFIVEDLGSPEALGF